MPHMPRCGQRQMLAMAHTLLPCSPSPEATNAAGWYAQERDDLATKVARLEADVADRSSAMSVEAGAMAAAAAAARAELAAAQTVSVAGTLAGMSWLSTVGTLGPALCWQDVGCMGSTMSESLNV